MRLRAQGAVLSLGKLRVDSRRDMCTSNQWRQKGLPFIS